MSADPAPPGVPASDVHPFSDGPRPIHHVLRKAGPAVSTLRHRC